MMSEADKQAAEIQKLNESRLLREAGKELLPLLAQMKADVLSRIIHASRAGESLIPAAAELTVLTDIENRITRNNKELARREEKLNGN